MRSTNTHVLAHVADSDPIIIRPVLAAMRRPQSAQDLIAVHSTLAKQQIRCSIVVSISACHAEDPGSIPGGGAFFIFSFHLRHLQRTL